MKRNATHPAALGLAILLAIALQAAPVLAQEGTQVPGETGPQLPQQNPPGPGVGGPDTFVPGEEIQPDADQTTAGPAATTVAWVSGVIVLAVAIAFVLWFLTRAGILGKQGARVRRQARRRSD